MKGSRLGIMVVDDNDMMRTLLRGIVRGGGHEVIGEASNGETAISMAERLKPDVVCLDVVMPGKHGLEVLGEIKATRPETEVIMITGSADPETVQEAIMNGASGFVVKPFNAARVLDTLNKIALKLRQKSD